MDERLLSVHSAIKSRELNSLTAAVSDLSESEGVDRTHNLIQMQVLPLLNPREMEWFWNSIASPVQSARVVELILKDTSEVLITQGYVIGRDFSMGLTDTGKKKLLLSKAARMHLERTLPKQKLVMLSLVTKKNHIRS
jgi:hypothetical protein